MIARRYVIYPFERKAYTHPSHIQFPVIHDHNVNHYDHNVFPL